MRLRYLDRETYRQKTSPHVIADLRRVITADRCTQLLIDLVRVPSPQTALMEAEPLLRKFIETAVGPRLSAMGFADIRYDPMGNLISTIGAGRSGRSLMLITNVMNQPAATMTNAYAGDVADGGAAVVFPGTVIVGVAVFGGGAKCAGG